MSHNFHCVQVISMQFSVVTNQPGLCCENSDRNFLWSDVLVFLYVVTHFCFSFFSFFKWLFANIYQTCVRYEHIYVEWSGSCLFLAK